VHLHHFRVADLRASLEAPAGRAAGADDRERALAEDQAVTAGGDHDRITAEALICIVRMSWATMPTHTPS
jgi:hypothetical protein